MLLLKHLLAVLLDRNNLTKKCKGFKFYNRENAIARVNFRSVYKDDLRNSVAVTVYVTYADLEFKKIYEKRVINFAIKCNHFNKHKYILPSYIVEETKKYLRQNNELLDGYWTYKKSNR